ncbi:cytochrome ubiquinol oxidase subunit I [Pseudobacillus badius]|uniref:cytochrome ubiquinol oxidase subunit I n=1 Tax=Bacillus badius TaxID=1455 RepID=UPI0007B0AADA|nr:cytochrome ubiquinol oxidase subunit I [Bacillus badius]KZO01521.1 cytochrome D ubiquinol oxidase subunit I [Bacillus badius]MED0667163.1 cytochrome ubiquinol oxidase subunit I [Bacillus badius]OCS89916.1 cytochrome D ubiquinol oxidase subunit I [Bacillus badius]OVE53442.1 cytochrome ubiquinol oxidase subunit I [Bacillus badius]TDW05799.1 cytochrome bd-I ubiquinol oxidase subunit 1 apoprotein [Bacillus badius]
MELDSVMLSRMLTSMTLAFHIIFATIGVGVPIMISIAEFIGIKRNDPYYLLLARRWARGFTITVAVGVVTGTAIGLQLSLLWPSFMEVAGQVIALPLFMETFAFFFEAIFLGIYLYTWDRFKNRMTHWLLTIPVMIGSSASALFITTVNSFMNTPQGFELEGGKAVNIDPIAAMFNPATPSKVFHVLTTSYMTAAAVLAAIAAFAIIRGKRSEYERKALRLTMICTFIFSILTAVAGDVSAKFLAEVQPEKLAAAEWHFETEEGADLILFGTLDENNEIKYELRLPKFLSFLAGNSFDTKVIGLNEFPEDERPPLWVHYMFDLMVSIGFFVLAVSGIYILLDKLKRFNQLNKPLLWMIVASGPLAMLAIEFGWIYAEVGRQPWILRGYMKVSEAATTGDGVGLTFILFALLYLVLGVICVFVLIRMFKNTPAEAELEQRFPNL